jgi:Uma2 family endonuclease
MAPDFCVEVRSRTDSWAATVEKCGRWIAHGVRVVWAVDPKGRQVLAFRPDLPPVEAGPGDVVDAAPVLPDFRVAIDDLFAGFSG